MLANLESLSFQSCSQMLTCMNHFCRYFDSWGGEFLLDFASLLKAPIALPLAETRFFLSKHLKSILFTAVHNLFWVILDFFFIRYPPQFFSVEAAGHCATMDFVSNLHPCKPDMKMSSQKTSGVDVCRRGQDTTAVVNSVQLSFLSGSIMRV